jgi:glycine cleavage system H protein
VVEINELLGDEPGKVNEDPQGDGWFFKIKISDPSELETLLDESAYQAHVESLE